jgi:hypothetical protein
MSKFLIEPLIGNASAVSVDVPFPDVGKFIHRKIVEELIKHYSGIIPPNTILLNKVAEQPTHGGVSAQPGSPKAHIRGRQY